MFELLKFRKMGIFIVAALKAGSNILRIKYHSNRYSIGKNNILVVLNYAYNQCSLITNTHRR